MTQPFASYDDFVGFGSVGELVQNTSIWTQDTITDLLCDATSIIEDRCDRRLAPFTGYVETFRAEGVAPDGLMNDDVPMDLRSALGRSQSIAFGSTDLVRDFWLSQFAPVNHGLWKYNLTNITLTTVYGAIETIPVGNVEGPQIDTGHLRLQLGTFCPPGTTVQFTYDGGYQMIPRSLKQACMFEAMKTLLLGAEPELRSGMSFGELDGMILSLIAPYVRY